MWIFAMFAALLCCPCLYCCRVVAVKPPPPMKLLYLHGYGQNVAIAEISTRYLRKEVEGRSDRGGSKLDKCIAKMTGRKTGVKGELHLLQGFFKMKSSDPREEDDAATGKKESASHKALANASELYYWYPMAGTERHKKVDDPALKKLQKDKADNFMQRKMNSLEKITGLDLDGDGDVANEEVTGEKISLRKQMTKKAINAAERATGLYIDGDGDVNDVSKTEVGGTLPKTEMTTEQAAKCIQKTMRGKIGRKRMSAIATAAGQNRAVSKLCAYIDELGGVDGVIGFSQGGDLCYLLAEATNQMSEESRERLQFMATFGAKDPFRQRKKWPASIMPTLKFYIFAGEGDKDSIRDSLSIGEAIKMAGAKYVAVHRVQGLGHGLPVQKALYQDMFSALELKPPPIKEPVKSKAKVKIAPADTVPVRKDILSVDPTPSADVAQNA